MRARELSEPYPTVALDSQAMEAVKAMAGQRLPGLIVCDEDGHPYTVLPGSQVLRFLIPRYVQDDPALARAFGERASDEMLGKLSTSTVRDVLPPKQEISCPPTEKSRCPPVASRQDARVPGFVASSDLPA